MTLTPFGYFTFMYISMLSKGSHSQNGPGGKAAATYTAYTVNPLYNRATVFYTRVQK